MLGLIRRGLAALWGGTAVVSRETPYFPEATRLFFLAPHNLTTELSGRLTRPYREHVWVYACVNAIAQSVSSVPLLFKTGPRKDPKVVEDDRLDSLFEAPNPYMSGSQLIEATLVYLGLTGEAFYILERESDRVLPQEIWTFHPHRFKEVVDKKTGLISGWVYSKGANKVPLQPHEVIFFRYFNPYHDYRGLAPIQAARAGKCQSGPPSPRDKASSKKVLDTLAPDQPRFIVGIGASAGSMEAYSQLFPPLAPDTGMAFIVVQHLDPKHESLLAELIGRMTRMPVTQAEDGMPVRPNRVYIIPPDANMALSQGFLKLVPRPERRGPYLTIDYLFYSLAEDQKEQAIGIILSGTSSDGTRGLEAIKGAGGITFAQDGKSAKYDYMPKSAIATGCVDFVLPPAEIAQELMRINRHPLLAVPGSVKPEEVQGGGTSFEQILYLLHQATGMDFSLYKQGTLQRRIGRRLVIHRLNSLEAYVNFLRETPAEIGALTEDLFIKVTGFFREPVAFEVQGQVFPPHFTGQIAAGSHPGLGGRLCHRGRSLFPGHLLGGISRGPDGLHSRPDFRHGCQRDGDREGPGRPVPGKYRGRDVAGAPKPVFLPRRKPATRSTSRSARCASSPGTT